MDFAEILARLLHERDKMTITRLAKLTGLPRSTVHRHLRGTRPSEGSISLYSQALDVPERDLRIAAGLAVPIIEGLDAESQTMAVVFARLPSGSRRLVWDLIHLLSGENPEIDQVAEPVLQGTM